MFFKESQCSIISKCENVGDAIILTIVFKHIHEFGSKPFTLILMINSKECDFIEQLFIEWSERDTSYNFIIYFQDHTFMIGIE